MDSAYSGKIHSRAIVTEFRSYLETSKAGSHDRCDLYHTILLYYYAETKEMI